MRILTDRQLDIAVGRLLRVGVTISAVLVGFGAILHLQHPLRPVPQYNHFIPMSTSLRGVGGVLSAALHLDADSIIQLGLLVLIATPVARVAFCIVGFAHQKDRLYVVISSSVLAILLYSLLQRGR